jgi:hypothetical protein
MSLLTHFLQRKGGGGREIKWKEKQISSLRPPAPEGEAETPSQWVDARLPMKLQTPPMDRGQPRLSSSSQPNQGCLQHCTAHLRPSLTTNAGPIPLQAHSREFSIQHSCPWLLSSSPVSTEVRTNAMKYILFHVKLHAVPSKFSISEPLHATQTACSQVASGIFSLHMSENKNTNRTQLWQEKCYRNTEEKFHLPILYRLLFLFWNL